MVSGKWHCTVSEVIYGAPVVRELTTAYGSAAFAPFPLQLAEGEVKLMFTHGTHAYY